ncbi:MAG TPA: hypothetical protein VGZ26_12570 [Pirellulales bacterium]|jgi:hypothetical protein|nr:hypothetical protein [Pirellulales bacterium]
MSKDQKIFWLGVFALAVLFTVVYTIARNGPVQIPQKQEVEIPRYSQTKIGVPKHLLPPDQSSKRSSDAGP